MARRNPGNPDTTEVEDSTMTAEEDTVTSVTEEAPIADEPEEFEPETEEDLPSDEPETEPVEATIKVKPADDAEPDFTEFDAAITAAVEARDVTTGDVPVAFVSAVQSAFRKLEGIKVKNAARKRLEAKLTAAMADMDLPLARAYFLLTQDLGSGVAEKGEAVAADPTAAAAERLAILNLALDYFVEPEGVKENLREQVEKLVADNGEAMTSYLEWSLSTAEDKGDEPQVGTLVRNAARLALGKGIKTKAARKASGGTSAGYTGNRRDIGKHIVEAFATVEPGTFLTISEIQKITSTEYGPDEPSAGAISARLFPYSGKMTVPGVKPGQNDKGNKGATKL